MTASIPTSSAWPTSCRDRASPNRSRPTAASSSTPAERGRRVLRRSAPTLLRRLARARLRPLRWLDPREGDVALCAFLAQGERDHGADLAAYRVDHVAQAHAVHGSAVDGDDLFAAPEAGGPRRPVRQHALDHQPGG